MELQGNLGGNKEQEVGLNVGHRLLHCGLFWMRSPPGRVSAVGRINGSGSLLLSQASEKVPHLFAEGQTERKVVELENLQNGFTTAASQHYDQRPTP